MVTSACILGPTEFVRLPHPKVGRIVAQKSQEEPKRPLLLILLKSRYSTLTAASVYVRKRYHQGPQICCRNFWACLDVRPTVTQHQYKGTTPGLQQAPSHHLLSTSHAGASGAPNAADGWLSKLWSPFGSPKYQVPYYIEEPKRDQHFDNRPDVSKCKSGIIIQALTWT